MRVLRHPETKRFQALEIPESEFRAMVDDSGGLCVACGEEASGVEPDARKLECEGCGRAAVYGLEELLMMGRVAFTLECDP